MTLEYLKIPGELEDIIEPETLMVCQRGQIRDHRGNHLLTQHINDGYAPKVSQRFLDKRGLEKGDNYVLVEYVDKRDGRPVMDVWKV